MRTVLSILFTVFYSLTLAQNAPKTISEATLVYDIMVKSPGTEPKMADAFDGATSTSYIKGSQSRTEMVSMLGTESTVYDNKTGNAFILKEYSGQKLMITLTKANWAEKNKAYDSVVYDYSSTETKTIAGYTCKKAVVTLAGSNKTFTVFYTTDIVLANKDFNSAFKNLPGVPLQYESEIGKIKITYTVSKVSFETVNASKFEAPKSGYRVMTYEENKQLKKQGTQK